ncbi:hypothetical protein EG329_001219 [Mollisiaceae sp. DMI_Dod_QoI]|nr:hypothetical protein EG329_001219 [Helotiales sp. DMI_Dod_QoI]
MSPFSQLTLPGMGGYGGGIDRDFSPILNYIDEFDRHFSRRHRFMNCFIPRFDLEEDAHNYYLYGDVPGATIDAITIEAHSNHTLVIYGKTTRSGPPLPPNFQEGPESPSEGGEFVKIQVEDREHTSEVQSTEHKQPSGTEITPAQGQLQPANTGTPYYPPPPTQPQSQQQAGHPHHERHRTFSSGGPETSHLATPNQPRILLSERLVGDFHRTFAFPLPVVEEGVRASLENGVLSLVVPKKEAGGEERRGRRVPIAHGNWWKGEERGSGFGFGGAAV